MKTVEIGKVSVDSGQIMIADPCYLDSLSDDYYENVCAATEQGAGNAKMFTHFGMAVVTRTAYGDGLYPVKAEMNDSGTILRLIIDFD